MLGLSQRKLALAVGVTFQSVHNYEMGTTRISVGRLYDVSRALDAPISFFFDEAPAITDTSHVLTGAEIEEPESVNLFYRRETLNLVRAYYRISDKSVRRQIYSLVKTIARRFDE